MTMFTYLFISGLCLLLLLHIVCKFWQNASRQRLAAQQVNLGQHVYVAQPDSLMSKLAAGRPT
jgi:hypothetical protein